MPSTIIGDRWKIGKTLGQGSFATVKYAVDIKDGEGTEAAVKIFDSVEDDVDLQEIEQEIMVMKDLKHKNCLQLYDVVVDEERSRIYIVMELALDELTLRMEEAANGRLPEMQARDYFSQLMAGLHHLHQNNIVHRDIKFENVLLDENDCIKIADFGMAKVSKHGKQLTTRCGSTRYISPEMGTLKPGQRYDGRAMDVWSSGVLLFAMLAGFLPFAQDSLADMLKAITEGRYQIPAFISENAQDLIKNMLELDADTRISMEAIREHEWLKSRRDRSRRRVAAHKKQSRKPGGESHARRTSSSAAAAATEDRAGTGADARKSAATGSRAQPARQKQASRTESSNPKPDRENNTEASTRRTNSKMKDASSAGSALCCGGRARQSDERHDTGTARSPEEREPARRRETKSKGSNGRQPKKEKGGKRRSGDANVQLGALKHTDQAAMHLPPGMDPHAAESGDFEKFSLNPM